MYCPSCGTKQEAAVAECARCELPLEPVAAHLAAHGEAVARFERRSREQRERLIAKGAFVALAAIPVGLAVASVGKRSASSAIEPASGAPPAAR